LASEWHWQSKQKRMMVYFSLSQLAKRAKAPAYSFFHKLLTSFEKDGKFLNNLIISCFFLHSN